MERRFNEAERALKIGMIFLAPSETKLVDGCTGCLGGLEPLAGHRA